MLKKLGLLCLILILPVIPVWAQEADSEHLSAVVQAYDNTAAVSLYRVEVTEESLQSMSFLTFASSVFAMDVDIYDAFVIDLSIETETSAEIEGDDISATIEIQVEQVQGEGLLYMLRDQEILQRPEDQESEIELTAQIRLVEDDLFVNMDETDPEFRQGVPLGWQETTTEVQLLSDAIVSMDDLRAALSNARLNVDSVLSVLTPEIVSSVDLIDEEDDLRHYQINFDVPTALEVLGIDLDAMLAEVIGDQTLEGDLVPAYAMEVWVGAEDGLVHQQVITLGLSGELAGDEGYRVLHDYQQVVTLELSDFNAEDIQVIPPPTTEIIG